MGPMYSIATSDRGKSAAGMMPSHFTPRTSRIGFFSAPSSDHSQKEKGAVAHTHRMARLLLLTVTGSFLGSPGATKYRMDTNVNASTRQAVKAASGLKPVKQTSTIVDVLTTGEIPPVVNSIIQEQREWQVVVSPV